MTSIYVRQDINHFVEFGWQRTRNGCSSSNKRLFIKIVDGSVLMDSDVGPSNLSNGEYRLLIFSYVCSSCATGYICRFFYDDPSGVRREISVPVHPATWSSARGMTAAELDTSDSTDSVTKHHANVWVQNNALVWKAANSTNNTRMRWFDDGLDNYDPLKTPGVGSTGDRIDYIGV